MRRIRILAGMALAVTGLSCGSPTEPAEDPWQEWSITFQRTQSDAFGGSACTNSFDMYCRTAHPDTGTSVGKLRHEKGTKTWYLEVAGIQYASDDVSDSTRIAVQRQDFSHWWFGLVVRTFGATSISGDYSEQIGPHNLNASGTFSGQRQ